jgi:hypothetical protein
MSSTLNAIIYRSGANADVIYARTKPSFVNAVVLQAAVEATIAVPEGAAVCIFSGDADFYVRPDATAAVPETNVTDGSSSELNPAQWDVHDVQNLHLVAPEDAVVTLSFYL